MKRLRFALAAAASLAGVLGSAVPASADVNIQYGQGQDACRTGYLCLYDNFGYNSGGAARVVMLNGDVPRLDYYCFNDVASSLVNHSDRMVRIYQDYDYKGTAITLLPGEVMDLNGTNFNDVASSARFFTLIAG